jgi:MYND finger
VLLVLQQDGSQPPGKPRRPRQHSPKPSRGAQSSTPSIAFAITIRRDSAHLKSRDTGNVAELDRLDERSRTTARRTQDPLTRETPRIDILGDPGHLPLPIVALTFAPLPLSRNFRLQKMSTATPSSFAPTFSKLTAAETAEATAHAEILGALLPYPRPDLPQPARAADWVAGFRMEACPRVELHYWTDVTLAALLAARAVAAGGALLAPDDAVRMARPERLQDAAAWWQETEEPVRRAIYSYVVASTAGMAATAVRAAVSAEQGRLYQACVDTVRLCRADLKEEVEQYRRRRMAAMQRCVACGAVSADLLRCRACGGAWFCGKECQANAWPAHKKECRKARREVVVGEAAGGEAEVAEEKEVRAEATVA